MDAWVPGGSTPTGGAQTCADGGRQEAARASALLVTRDMRGIHEFTKSSIHAPPPRFGHRSTHIVRLPPSLSGSGVAVCVDDKARGYDGCVCVGCSVPSVAHPPRGKCSRPCSQRNTAHACADSYQRTHAGAEGRGQGYPGTERGAGEQALRGREHGRRTAATPLASRSVSITCTAASDMANSSCVPRRGRRRRCAARRQASGRGRRTRSRRAAPRQRRVRHARVTVDTSLGLFMRRAVHVSWVGQRPRSEWTDFASRDATDTPSATPLAMHPGAGQARATADAQRRATV